MVWIFWLSLFLLGFTYAGYPVLLALTSRAWNRPVRTGGSSYPAISVVLVVRNEADRIVGRLANLLECDFRGEREIIVVCGDCRDDTAARARSIDGPITVIEAPASQTKAAGVNLGIEAASGDLVVFADARQRFENDTVVKLAEPFDDPSVGAVSGNLEIEKVGGGAGAGIDFYWKLERFVRHAESRIDSSIGCTGAVYAIRRSLFRPIPADTILDDVVIPMRIALQGKRVIFRPDAPAYDPQTLAPEREQRRKMRTLAGNWQMLFRYPSWLSPVTNRLWAQLIAHKYLRLLGPAFLVGCLVPSAFLAKSHGFFLGTLWAQAIAYGLALIGILVPGLGVSLVSIPAAFLFLQGQCVRAFFYYLGFRPKDGW